MGLSATSLKVVTLFHDWIKRPVSESGSAWEQARQGRTQRRFGPFHYDMGHSVSPAVLEPVGESPIGHRFEPTDCQWRTGHVKTQTLESIPIVGGHSYISVQAHTALSCAARRNPTFRFDTTLPGIERLDPITKTPPTLARLGARRDPRANRRGREQSQQRVVRRQGVLIRIETPALDNPENSTGGPRQNPPHIFGLRRRKRNERSEIV
jgi:hypothetical protein